MLADVARALPGALLVGLIPGFALATVLAPAWRWWERLAAAPGLSAGIAGVLGLVLHDVHAPFELQTVLPVEAVIVVLAVLRFRSVQPDARPLRSGRGVRTAVAVGIFVGVVTAVVAAVSLRDEVVPLGTDSPVHGQTVNAIASDHDTLAAVTVPVDRSAVTRPRTGFEAEAALLAALGAPDGARAMMPLALLAIALIPLGLTLLALEAGCSPLLAGLAPMLGAGMPFPRVAVGFGGFPLLVEATLIVPLVVAAVRTVRGRQVGANLGIITAAVGSMWIIHGTELLTALAIATPFVAAVLLSERPPGWWRRAAMIVAACGAAALLVSALRRMPGTPTPVVSPLGGTDVAPQATVIAPIRDLGLGDFYNSFLRDVMPLTALIGLYLAGIATAFLRRQLRWVVVAHLILLAALTDDTIGGHVDRLWTAVFPWSSRDRLAFVQYWVLPLLLALGLVAVIELATRELARVRGYAKASRAVAVGATTVAATILVAGLTLDVSSYGDLSRNERVVGSADLQAMQDMAARLPAGAIVLTDGTDDSGQWVGALTPQVNFFYKDYLNHHAQDARIVALENACSAPVDRALLNGVDAIFVGSRPQHDAVHPWKLSCVQSIPWLRQVADVRAADTEAAVFAVMPVHS